MSYGHPKELSILKWMNETVNKLSEVEIKWLGAFLTLESNAESLTGVQQITMKA